MKGILAALGCAVIVSGCAVSKDGLGFPQRGKAIAASGLVIIGTTGPLRSVNDKERGEFYRAYAAVAAQTHPNEPPSMSAAGFQEKLAGWASIQTFSIPGIVSSRVRVLVPTSLVHDTRFASAAGSFMFGTTGDLVAARSDADGLVWLERVLCPDDGSYHICAGAYQSGFFDEKTGRELTRQRKPKAHGALIDVSSYVKLSNDIDRHSASDLEHCNCDFAKPGSTEAVVRAQQLQPR
jgi:hypothetical protein